MQVTSRISRVLRRIPNRKIKRVDELLPRYAVSAAKPDAASRSSCCLHQCRAHEGTNLFPVACGDDG